MAWATAAALVPALANVTCAGEGSSDQRFLAGLRERRLFELAESYCTGRLQEANLPDSRRAELVIELSLTLADWAVNSAPDQRQSLWRRAVDVTEDFAQRHPESPRLVLVRLQGALGLLARGELARQEAQLLAQNGRLLQEAQTSLEAALQRLQELGEEVEHRLRESSLPGGRNTAPSETNQLTVRQLTSLRDSIQYQLARAYRNQGQCFEAQSADWANSLTRAVEMLGPLSNLDTTHPLAWRSRVNEIVCHRLLADYATAQRKLEALQAAKPPPAIALRARAEQLRLAVADNRLAAAVQLLSEGRQLDGVTSGELDYALLETCLAAWRAADELGNQEAAAQWQAKANDVVRLIGREDGPYWIRRAQMLLSGDVQRLPGGDLEMWVQAAENAYHSGQLDEALAAYDRARGLAQQQGRTDQAFHLGFVAATIEHHRERHEQAMRRYERLAMATPEQARAPETHLLAIYHAGQIARTEPPGSLDQYIALAETHLATWPEASTANEVRWCLGRSREHRREWQKAIEQYRAIAPDYPQFVKVVEGAAHCYEAWLDQSKTTGKPTDEIAAAAAGWFESLVVGPEGRLRERWGPLARSAAIHAATFRLHCTTPDFGRAERILSAALDGASDAPAEWQSAARALLVLSLAGQGRRQEAADMLRQISTGPPGQLLDMLQGLGRVGTTAAPQVRAELAALQSSAVELLRTRREELPPSGQKNLDRIAAQALADLGQIDAALDAYRRLAQAHPHDGEIQEGYARLLLSREDRPSQEAALAKWREVEKKSRPGSDRWFSAKYAVALLHDRSNNREQAEKMIRLLAVLYPEPRLRDREVTARFAELLDPRLRAEFFELLNRCGQ
ncbi:MAG: tetratricopeptide repeat protein [Planctomycetota bacterium]